MVLRVRRRVEELTNNFSQRLHDILGYTLLIPFTLVFHSLIGLTGISISWTFYNSRDRHDSRKSRRGAFSMLAASTLNTAGYTAMFLGALLCLMTALHGEESDGRRFEMGEINIYYLLMYSDVEEKAIPDLGYTADFSGQKAHYTLYEAFYTCKNGSVFFRSLNGSDAMAAQQQGTTFQRHNVSSIVGNFEVDRQFMESVSKALQAFKGAKDDLLVLFPKIGITEISSKQYVKFFAIVPIFLEHLSGLITELEKAEEMLLKFIYSVDHRVLFTTIKYGEITLQSSLLAAISTIFNAVVDMSPQCKNLMVIWNQFGKYLCDWITTPAQYDYLKKMMKMEEEGKAEFPSRKECEIPVTEVLNANQHSIKGPMVFFYRSTSSIMRKIVNTVPDQTLQRIGKVIDNAKKAKSVVFQSALENPIIFSIFLFWLLAAGLLVFLIGLNFLCRILFAKKGKEISAMSMFWATLSFTVCVVTSVIGIIIYSNSFDHIRAGIEMLPEQLNTTTSDVSDFISNVNDTIMCIYMKQSGKLKHEDGLLFDSIGKNVNKFKDDLNMPHWKKIDNNLKEINNTKKEIFGDIAENVKTFHEVVSRLPIPRFTYFPRTFTNFEVSDPIDMEGGIHKTQECVKNHRFSQRLHNILGYTLLIPFILVFLSLIGLIGISVSWTFYGNCDRYDYRKSRRGAFSMVAASTLTTAGYTAIETFYKCKNGYAFFDSLNGSDVMAAKQLRQGAVFRRHGISRIVRNFHVDRQFKQSINKAIQAFKEANEDLVDISPRISDIRWLSNKHLWNLITVVPVFLVRVEDLIAELEKAEKTVGSIIN
uniref:Prominin-1 n=1 Tax=Angiostrongylus cantonensis TaxID=6313 RepID=A0A0K0DDE0_ANGCA